MSSHADNPNAHHILPVSVYVKTLLVLFFLMALTIGAAEFSAANHVPTIAANIIAMTIAVVKATLVVMFFMHVKYGTALVKMWAAMGFIWFFLLFMIGVDYYTRQWEPVPTWDKSDAGSSTPRFKVPLSSDPSQVNVRPR